MARRRCGKRMSASRKTAESRDAYVVEPIPDSGSCSANALKRAHIATVTLRFSPRFGSSPVNQAFANSNTVRAALAGPSHNSAIRGSIRNRHTLGSVGPLAPHLVGLSPNVRNLRGIAHDAGSDREVSFRLRLDEHEADVGGGFDFVLLGAVDVRDGKDQACFPIGPCLDGARSRPAACVVSMHTPTFSMMSQTRSPLPCSLTAMHLLCQLAGLRSPSAAA